MSRAIVVISVLICLLLFPGFLRTLCKWVLISVAGFAAVPFFMFIGLCGLACIIGLGGMVVFVPFTLWSAAFGDPQTQRAAIHGIPVMLELLAVFLAPFVLVVKGMAIGRHPRQVHAEAPNTRPNATRPVLGLTVDVDRR